MTEDHRLYLTTKAQLQRHLLFAVAHCQGLSVNSTSVPLLPPQPICFLKAPPTSYTNLHPSKGYHLSPQGSTPNKKRHGSKSVAGALNLLNKPQCVYSDCELTFHSQFFVVSYTDSKQTIGFAVNIHIKQNKTNKPLIASELQKLYRSQAK